MVVIGVPLILFFVFLTPIYWWWIEHVDGPEFQREFGFRLEHRDLALPSGSVVPAMVVRPISGVSSSLPATAIKRSSRWSSPADHTKVVMERGELPCAEADEVRWSFGWRAARAALSSRASQLSAVLGRR